MLSGLSWDRVECWREGLELCVLVLYDGHDECVGPVGRSTAISEKTLDAQTGSHTNCGQRSQVIEVTSTTSNEERPPRSGCPFLQS